MRTHQGQHGVKSELESPLTRRAGDLGSGRPTSPRNLRSKVTVGTQGSTSPKGKKKPNNGNFLDNGKQSNHVLPGSPGIRADLKKAARFRKGRGRQGFLKPRKTAIFHYFGSERVKSANLGAVTGSDESKTDGKFLPFCPSQSSQTGKQAELWPALLSELRVQAASACLTQGINPLRCEQGRIGHKGRLSCITEADSSAGRPESSQLKESKNFSQSSLSHSTPSNENMANNGEPPGDGIPGNGTPIPFTVASSRTSSIGRRCSPS